MKGSNQGWAGWCPVAPIIWSSARNERTARPLGGRSNRALTGRASANPPEVSPKGSSKPDRDARWVASAREIRHDFTGAGCRRSSHPLTAEVVGCLSDLLTGTGFGRVKLTNGQL